MQRVKGTLVKWNDARGFGFIEVPEQEKQVYLHIKAMREASIRPAPGNQLEFTLGTGRNGGPAARDAVLVGLPARREVGLRIWVAAALMIMVQSAVVLGLMPLWVEGLYAAMGLLSLYLYHADKQAAAQHRWRIRELSLNLCDLAFGIIGGLVAQHVLKHKTGKPSFQVVTGLIAALHLSILTAVIAELLSWQIVWAFLVGLAQLV
jgi:uncharacterized membrane protein YsdA (DUF1294 family)/cold shock CspA family protein